MIYAGTPSLSLSLSLSLSRAHALFLYLSNSLSLSTLSPSPFIIRYRSDVQQQIVCIHNMRCGYTYILVKFEGTSTF